MPAMETRVHKLFTRASEPACPTCAFSLKGLAEQGNCPECGNAYEPGTSYPLVPPSPLRALWHAVSPIGIGALIVLVIGAVGASTRDEFRAVTTIVVAGIIGCACVIWASWRFIVLVDALQKALPAQKLERSSVRAFGCIGTGLAGIIGVVALGLGAMLTLALGACLIESVR